MAASFAIPGTGIGTEAGKALGRRPSDGEAAENSALPLATTPPVADPAPIAVGSPAEVEGLRVSPVLERLPVELDVCVPVRQFRVRHLLALEPGHVIESLWHHGNDVPLTAGQVRLAWSEFEVIAEQLAVRVTRLP